MKAHFRTLLAACLLLLSSLGLHAQEAAPTPAEKKAIAMAGKHEISFNLRNLSFNEVNNSILGLAYRYHWNAKWNLRVQADASLFFLQRRGDFSDTTAPAGVISLGPNNYNYAALLGIERKIPIGPGQLLCGLNLGFAVFGQDRVSFGNGPFQTYSRAPIITGRDKITSYRIRPCLAYRWQFHKNISATIETQFNIEYQAIDAGVPISGVFATVTTYAFVFQSVPISALTLNIHLK